MARETILIILGLIVALSPWSGLPLAWLSYILVGVGLLIVLIGSTLRARRMVELVKPPAFVPAAIEEPTLEESVVASAPEPAVPTPPASSAPTRTRNPLPPSRSSRIAKF